MVINDERKGKYKWFEDLFTGDVFTFEDKIFMKIERIEFGDDENDFYNVVSVRDGALRKFDNNDSVIPLVAQLHILREG